MVGGSTRNAQQRHSPRRFQMAPRSPLGAQRVSRRSLLRGALGTATGLSIAGGLSGCGSPISAGLFGSELAPGTLTFWNLFGGGDGARLQTMLSRRTPTRTAARTHYRRRPSPGATRTTRRSRWPRSATSPPDVAVSAPDPGAEPGAGRPADPDHRRHARLGRSEAHRLQPQGLGDPEARRQVLRDPARHPPLRPVTTTATSARRPACSTPTAR